MKNAKILAAVLLIALTAAALFSCVGKKPSPEESTGSDTTSAAAETVAEEGIKVGNTDPDFTFALTDGTEKKLSDYRGKTVFLNFWATWCGYCVSEMPNIQKIHEERGDVAVIAVNCQESAATVDRFISNNSYTFIAALDANGRISYRYNVNGIPMTYVIDPSGVITAVHTGMLSEEKMNALLPEKG